MQNPLSLPDGLQLGQRSPAFGHRLRQDLTPPAPLGLQLAGCRPGDLSASITVCEPVPHNKWVYISVLLYTSIYNTYSHMCSVSLENLSPPPRSMPRLSCNWSVWVAAPRGPPPFALGWCFLLQDPGVSCLPDELHPRVAGPTPSPSLISFRISLVHILLVLEMPRES